MAQLSPVVLAFTFGFALAASGSMAHAQTTPDIDWANVLTAERDPHVSVSVAADGTPAPLFPGSAVRVVVNDPRLGPGDLNGGAAVLDDISYGDIVGDGATEAVIPLSTE